MASLHVDATTPSATIQESTLMREQWMMDLFEGNGAVVHQGFAELPSKPGLGVTLNEKVAAMHPYKPVTRSEYVFGDGAVEDQ
jgi:L-alanine-DL-glutamate epimerase-like enolase superfamily enzyme